MIHSGEIRTDEGIGTVDIGIGLYLDLLHITLERVWPQKSEVALFARTKRLHIGFLKCDHVAIPITKHDNNANIRKIKRPSPPTPLPAGEGSFWIGYETTP